MSAFTLFLILVAIVPSESYESYNKTHYTFLDEWRKIDTKFKDGRVFYSNCTRKGSSVKECTVVMDKTAHSNDSYVCDISVKSERSDGKIRRMQLLGGLGHDKALFHWLEVNPVRNNSKQRKRYFTYAILNMDNNCTFTTVKLDKEDLPESYFRQTTAVIYDNSFDLFYENRTACGKKACRITYDAEGRVLKELRPFAEGMLENIGSWTLRSLSDDPLNDGYFFSIRAEKECDDFLYSKHHSPVNTFATSYYLVKNENLIFVKCIDSTPEVHFSSAYNVKTACSIDDYDIDCIRFDSENDNLTATTLSSNGNQRKRLTSIRNTADGNILILYETTETDDGSCKHAALAKFDLKGRLVGSSVIKGYCGEMLDMSEDEEGNYCVVDRCTKELDNMWGEKEMIFNYQCFNDNDLLQ